jgi:hypothetical protein
MTYRPQSKTSTASRHNAPKPARTPYSSRQSSRPSAEAKKQTERNNERKKWLDFERLQEQSIRQCRNRLRSIEDATAVLQANIKKNMDSLAFHRVNVSYNLPRTLSENKKNELQRQILDNEAAIRIKKIRLKKDYALLEWLEGELQKRRDQELERLAAECKESQSNGQAQANARARDQAARNSRAKAEAEAKARAKAQAAREAAEADVSSARAQAEARARKQAACKAKAKAEAAADYDAADRLMREVLLHILGAPIGLLRWVCKKGLRAVLKVERLCS